MIKAKTEDKGVRVRLGGTIDDIMDEIAYTTYSLLENCERDVDTSFAKTVFADICVRVRNIYREKRGEDIFDLEDDLLLNSDDKKKAHSLAKLLLDGMSSAIADDGMEDDLPNFFGQRG